MVVQCYNQEQRGRSLVWVLRKRLTAKAADYAAYMRASASVSLPNAGKWRLRAYHPTD